jgi:sulfite exporter TauE/SafE
MPPELSGLTAFIIGLLGSVHCVGMCGGIVGALTIGLPQTIRNSTSVMLAYLFAYNIGRITSYAVAGAIAGTLGSQLYSLVASELASEVGRWISGIFMIALGIYLAGWTRLLAPIERIGAHAWRHIEPLGRRFLPVDSPRHALGLGLIWGWLPCGLVYSALVWAMASGDTLSGAQLMVAFGLGTLPMLLLMGATARWLGGLVRKHWIRRLAGAVIMAFAVIMLAFPPTPTGGGHSMHGHSIPTFRRADTLSAEPP